MSRREQLATVLDHLGVLAVLERMPQSHRLLILNYHRIGDPAATSFDREVFSTDAEGLDRQVRALKRRYRIIDAAEAEAIVVGKKRRPGLSILLTFDDGYRDNLEVAVPILRSHGVQAVFFLVTGFLEKPHTVAWWDRIAWLIRQLVGRRLEITAPEPVSVDVTADNADSVIRQVLALYRSSGGRGELIGQLEHAATVTPDGREPPQFLDWSGAARLRDAGMAIGLHTHAHPILSSLDETAQEAEIATCRTLLRERLGVEATLLAYPVGSPAAFSAATRRAAERAGCTAAFSFYGGINRPGAIDRFDVRRVAFQSFAHLPRNRMSVATLARDGRTWF
ncbi:MAG: polysaccharide deacetylase family protein [Hyphomicrobiaceae bacterium]|nr:polysaccharide deacetylase family protein [Hyphomicrobiaceae bacterium]